MSDAGTRREFRAQPGPSDDPARPSVVIGRLWHARRTAVANDDVGDPATAVAAAFAAVATDLQRLAADLRRRGQVEPAHIVEASVLIAGDPDLRALVDRAVASGVAPVTAVTGGAEHFAQLLSSLDDPVLAARAADIRAVGRRLAAALSTPAAALGTPAAHSGEAINRRVVMAHEVTADDLLVDSTAVVAALSVVGGATAHVGIVARSLGVPVLFDIDPALLDLADGTEVLLDGRAGIVVVAPDAADRRRAQTEQATVHARQIILASARGGPLSTGDGETVVVLANVASVADARLAVVMDAAGVGLLRTEMPFLGASTWPSYDEHVAALRPVLEPLRGRPVTVRTLDFSDDKLPPFLMPGPGGPVASGLQLMLAEPEAFGAQLRAIIHCGLEAGVRLSVMFPVVDSVATFQRCRALVTAAAAEVGTAVVAVGAMVETREAIGVIEQLAAVADFLSLGTNDLTAAILRLGRRDPLLTPARLRDPAVLDAVARTVRAGRAHGRPVSVCGDAASEPSLVGELLDVGCRTFSVAPSMVDEVRQAVRDYREAGDREAGDREARDREAGDRGADLSGG